MSDIVERLRVAAAYEPNSPMNEAADEIERLRADLKQQGDYSVQAYAERDQYMESNVTLAADIRYLRAINAELVGALKAAVDQLTDLDSRFMKCAECSAREAYDSFYQSNVAGILQQARAAIAKAEGKS